MATAPGITAGTTSPIRLFVAALTHAFDPLGRRRTRVRAGRVGDGAGEPAGEPGRLLWGVRTPWSRGGARRCRWRPPPTDSDRLARDDRHRRQGGPQPTRAEPQNYVGMGKGTEATAKSRKTKAQRTPYPHEALSAPRSAPPRPADTPRVTDLRPAHRSPQVGRSSASSFADGVENSGSAASPRPETTRETALGGSPGPQNNVVRQMKALPHRNRSRDGAGVRLAARGQAGLRVRRLGGESPIVSRGDAGTGALTSAAEPPPS